MSPVLSTFPYRRCHTHPCLSDRSVRAVSLMLVTRDRKLRRQPHLRETVKTARKKSLTTRNSPSRRHAFFRNRSPHAHCPPNTVYPGIVYHAYLTEPIARIGVQVPFPVRLTYSKGLFAWAQEPAEAGAQPQPATAAGQSQSEAGDGQDMHGHRCLPSCTMRI